MTSTLIVGGLTVDRFADGSVAPGGSVLHSGLAAVEAGSELTILTVAGDEPTAAEGLARLAAIGTVARQAAPMTTTYRHEERDGVRVLILEARSEPIRADGLRGLRRPDVALVAPIADDVPASLVARMRDELAPPRTVLLVQGWLRRLVEGEEVTATSLEALTEEQCHGIGEADAIVVSTEDLVESPGDPFGQAAELRRHAGPRPAILVTLGAQGYLLDDPNDERVVASVPRRVVIGVPAVGAGDTFGAALAVHLAHGVSARVAADRATDAVIAMLESRQRNRSVPEHRPEPA